MVIRHPFKKNYFCPPPSPHPTLSLTTILLETQFWILSPSTSSSSSLFHSLRVKNTYHVGIADDLLPLGILDNVARHQESDSAEVGDSRRDDASINIFLLQRWEKKLKLHNKNLQHPPSLPLLPPTTPTHIDTHRYTYTHLLYNLTEISSSVRLSVCHLRSGGTWDRSLDSSQGVESGLDFRWFSLHLQYIHTHTHIHTKVHTHHLWLYFFFHLSILQVEEGGWGARQVLKMSARLRFIKKNWKKKDWCICFINSSSAKQKKLPNIKKSLDHENEWRKKMAFPFCERKCVSFL